MRDGTTSQSDEPAIHKTGEAGSIALYSPCLGWNHPMAALPPKKMARLECEFSRANSTADRKTVR